jgi:toxin ParE1/3/4
MIVRYTDIALAEVDELLAYIAERSPQGAANVRRAIEDAVSRLEEQPFSGRQTDISGVRLTKTARYPYLIFHYVSEGELAILHVRHGARLWPENLEPK